MVLRQILAPVLVAACIYSLHQWVVGNPAPALIDASAVTTLRQVESRGAFGALIAPKEGLCALNLWDERGQLVFQEEEYGEGQVLVNIDGQDLRVRLRYAEGEPQHGHYLANDGTEVVLEVVKSPDPTGWSLAAGTLSARGARVIPAIQVQGRMDHCENADAP